MIKLGDEGFTRIQIILVLAVVAILATVLVPVLTGFTGGGKEDSYRLDQRTLQAAVDRWRTDVTKRLGQPWPVLDPVGCIGAPSPNCNSYLDIKKLADEGYLKSASV